MSCANQIESTKGFTLIEIIMVIVILGILSVFTFSFIDSAVKTYTTVSKQRVLYQEASYIMERITRELRDMSNLSTCNYALFDNTFTFTKRHRTIEGVDNISISFRRDVDTNIMYRDGGISPYPPIGNNITFFRIERGQGGSSLPICNCSFLITLTLQNSDQSITLRSKVTPKNMGSSNFTDRCFNGDYEDITQ